jgi:hypothetical protein
VAAWKFILTDLQGNVHGEVRQASSRNVTLPHLRIPSASFTMPLWDSLATTVMDTDCLLKCYRDDALAFHGPVITAEEQGSVGSQTVQVTAAGPYWRLTKRLIPASKTSGGFAQGSASSLIDLGTIARTILTDVNGEQFTGIDLGTHAASTSGWIGRWLLKNAAEGIAELAAGLSSFEFRVRPTEGAVYPNPGQNWQRIGLFDVAPLLGQSRPDAVFEYGTSRANVESYTRTKTRDGILTSAFVSVSGWPDTVERDASGNVLYSPVQRRPDSAALSNRGLYEEVINDAGVLDNAFREKIGDFHVNLRKNPRERILFKPAINAKPSPLVDYEPGDTVRARAVVRGSLRFDALFRIWGITFDVDENGNENVELELVQP